ncbi:MAG: hypothetical protein ACXVNO_01685, partial [Bacteroidia bacterium]
EIRIAKEVTFHLQFIFLFASLLVGIWIKELFPLLINNQSLLVAYKITFVIILSYSFRPLYVMPVNFLGYTGRTSALWKITFIGALVNIVLNIICIPIYGFFVAAIVTFISLLLIAIIGYFLKSFKDVCTEDFKILWWALLILILSGLAYLVLEAGIWIKSLATVSLLYFLVRNIFKLNILHRNYKLF